MKQRLRFVLAACIALTGAILAVRGLYRQPAPRTPDRIGTVEDTAEIVSAREYIRSFEDDLVVLQREEVPSVLEEIGMRTESEAKELASRTSITERQQRDLGTAFAARLEQLLGGTFDENIRDLTSRGWELPDEEYLAKRRAQWERHVRDAPLPPIAPTDITVRVLDPELLKQPGGLKLAGYGLTMLSYDAPGSAGYFDFGGQAIVEVTIPMQIEDISGKAFTALIGYVFAWDDRLERWRTLRVLRHYADPDTDGIAVWPLI